MVVYINCKTSKGTKTLSSVNQKNYRTPKEFQKEWYKQLCDYTQIGHDAYVSKRATKEWRNNQK